MKQKLSLFLAIIISFAITTGFTTQTTAKQDMPAYWVVSHFSTNDEIFTDQYANFQFRFAEDGSVVANDMMNEYNGHYISDKETFFLRMDGEFSLEQLSGDWYVKEQTESEMVLGHEDGRRLIFNAGVE